MDIQSKRTNMLALKGALRMHKSLISTIEKAGASGKYYQWDLLAKEVKDLFMLLGPNHIRFIYRKPKGKKYE